MQTERELLEQRDPAGFFSQEQKLKVLRARRQFIEAPSEYIEKLRDNIAFYDELEQACRDPRISRSWLANLEIFPLIWTARRTLIEQRSRCVAWITALKEDRYKDLSDDAFLFSREEIRTLIMQRLLTQGCGATTMRG